MSERGKLFGTHMLDVFFYFVTENHKKRVTKQKKKCKKLIYIQIRIAVFRNSSQTRPATSLHVFNAEKTLSKSIHSTWVISKNQSYERLF